MTKATPNAPSARPARARCADRYARGPPGQPGARRAALGRGLPGAVDARREPDQVAPRARHLVLRDLPPRALRARLPAVRPGVPRALQQLLQGRRRAASAAAARPGHAADAGRGASAIAPTSTSGCWRCSRARPATPRSTRWSTLGLQHEQQHQELLLTDIKHALSLQSGRVRRTRGAGRWRRCGRSRCAGSATTAAWSSSATSRRSTAPSASTTRRRATAPTPTPFEIASRPVTYGEYLAFIDDGGYARPELWLSMGWDWVQAGRRTRAALLARATAIAGSTTRCRARSRSTRTRRSATSATSRPTRSRAGPARGCRPSSNGSIAARPLRAPPTRQLRRPRRLPPAAADRADRRRAGADVRRRLGVDRSRPTLPYPGYRPLARRGRRVQRQVHVQPVRAARRLVRDAAPATSAPATATSSRPTRSGSSAACGWPATL